MYVMKVVIKLSPLKKNASKNNTCLTGVSHLGMGDPPIDRPSSKGQEDNVQQTIVAITTNILLLLLILLISKMKMEPRQIDFRKLKCLQVDVGR
jgi:hypothetical protein